MAENFGALERRSLLEITLPGSHNSGNYQGGLHADALPGKKSGWPEAA